MFSAAHRLTLILVILAVVGCNQTARDNMTRPVSLIEVRQAEDIHKTCPQLVTELNDLAARIQEMNENYKPNLENFFKGNINVNDLEAKRNQAFKERYQYLEVIALQKKCY